jgi:tetratricopeptide (TPR) repeat protein
MDNTPEKKKIVPIVINTLIVVIMLFGAIRGIQYYNQYKNHEAIDGKIKAAVSGDQLLPIDIEAHRLIAEHYCTTGRPEKALPHYQRILSFRPKDRQLRYEFATTCLDAKNYKQALKEFSTMELNKQPDTLTPKIAARKGITLFYLDRIAESKEALKRCLERSPNTAEAVCFLGQIEATEADSAQALSHLEQAISLDPAYVEGWYQLARYRMEHGNYGKAQQILQHALEIDPLNGKCHARLGMIYYYLENKILAKKSYLTAIALNPKDVNTRYNLGELYYTAFADTENALREYSATLKINPDHVEANFKVGLICLRNNMVKESIRYFRNAMKTDPENVRVLLQLGVAYEKIGDQERALKAYQKVITVDALNSIAIQKIKYLSNMK